MIGDILYILLGLVIVLVIGFFVSKKLFTKQLQDNPPVNENMIRAMMSSMGRKPSEKQVKQVMQQMNRYR